LYAFSGKYREYNNRLTITKILTINLTQLGLVQ
jgi:hypothetical protein